MAKKKNIAMFSFTTVSENSMIASVRIARWLQGQMGDIPIVTGKEIGDMKELDALIIVNGAYRFCRVLPELSIAIGGADKVIWCQNDYTIIPPKTDSEADSPFRRVFVERKNEGKKDTVFWTTCEKWATMPGSSYVNWNMLTFDEKYSPKMIESRRKRSENNLFYYGSFRDGSGKSSRVPLFDRYFKAPHVRTLVSSPTDKFAERYPNVETMPAIKQDFFSFLGTQGLGLYIEDRKSSEEFHSPANRFYEMLSAGLPMVFMPESGSMMRKAGFNPDPYVVPKAIDVKRFMKNRDDVGKEQRKNWVSDFRRKLEAQLAEARQRTGV